MKYALVFFLATALQAQISSLATNADGSELQFLSNYGTPADPARVFRLYSYAPGTPTSLFRAADPYTALQPLAPLLSADGQTRGMVTYTPCFGSCMFWIPRNAVTLTRNGRPFDYKAQGVTQRLSRNGRWLFDAGFPNFSARLIDIDSGATTTLPPFNPLHPVYAIADNGTLLTNAVDNRNAVTLVAATARTEFSLPEAVVSAAILPNGQKLFALTQSTLYQLNPLREIYTSATPLTGFSPSASSDEFLVHSDRQVILLSSNQIYESPDPIREVLLAADGQSFFVLTRFNRLTKITNGVPTELYPPFPGAARQTSYGAVPGSLLRLSGGPFPEELTITSQGRQLPKIASTTDSYEVQIPWDFPVDSINSFLITRPGSPFAISDNLNLQRDPVAAIYTAAFESEAKAAHADFQSLVTPENPAPAGSVIHFWLTGLGPVDATGKPLAPFACYILQGDAVRGLELPFAAYAPGLVGVYQVDAIIPADWPAGPSTLTCAVGQNPPVSYANIHIRLPN